MPVYALLAQGKAGIFPGSIKNFSLQQIDFPARLHGCKCGNMCLRSIVPKILKLLIYYSLINI